MSEPRIKKRTRRKEPPYALNEFSDDALRSIARSLVAKFIISSRDSIDLSGEEWEQVFAKAIGAKWHRTNTGLDDVVLDDCAWAAKTVKCGRPRSKKTVRLISGRNSPYFSYDIDNVTKVPPDELGHKVLEIWNSRVRDAQASNREIRTVVLIRAPDLLEAVLFEIPTQEYDARQYRWEWNERKNLVGKEGNVKRFTWQPHGSQFTIHVTVPERRYLIKLTLPDDDVSLSRDDLLDLVGCNDSWYTFSRL
jgi:hypothetical protein